MENPFDPQIIEILSKQELINYIKKLVDAYEDLAKTNKELVEACKMWQKAYNLSRPKQYESSRWESDMPEVIDLTKDAKPYVNPFNNPMGVVI